MSPPKRVAINSSKGTLEWHSESDQISVSIAHIKGHLITLFTLSSHMCSQNNITQANS